MNPLEPAGAGVGKDPGAQERGGSIPSRASGGGVGGGSAGSAGAAGGWFEEARFGDRIGRSIGRDWSDGDRVGRDLRRRRQRLAFVAGSRQGVMRDGAVQDRDEKRGERQ